MPYALRFGMLLGIVAFVGGIVSGYYIISAEPSSTALIIQSVLGIGICLLAGFGGFLAVRAYSKDNPVAIPFGQGAIIGLIVGLEIAVISSILSLVWKFVDPNFVQNMTEASINHSVAAMGSAADPDSMRDIMEQAGDPNSFSKWLMQFGIAGLLYGILNLISGIIGASVFGKKEETF